MTTGPQGYRRDELMVIEASRRIRDGEVVLAGTGLPIIAILQAQKTHAPGVYTLVESGPFDPVLLPSLISVSDPKIQYRAARLGSLREVLGGVLQRGLVDLAMLGGAQVDQFGNLNSSLLGPHGRPTVRLPGSGGANDLASLARRLMVIMRHEKRRFPPRVDYITSPGYIDGPDGRRRAGLPVPQPDYTLVTDLCVMEVDRAQGRLRVTALMPGVDLEEVLASTGFAPLVAERLATVAPPTAEELRVLREGVDPARFYFKGSGE